MRAELSGLVAEGKDRDTIIKHFVSEYGSQEVLASPIDRGFNRLAWLLPYGIGLAGIVVVAEIGFLVIDKFPVLLGLEAAAILMAVAVRWHTASREVKARLPVV